MSMLFIMLKPLIIEGFEVIFWHVTSRVLHKFKVFFQEEKKIAGFFFFAIILFAVLY